MLVKGGRSSTKADATTGLEQVNGQTIVSITLNRCTVNSIASRLRNLNFRYRTNLSAHHLSIPPSHSNFLSFRTWLSSILAPPFEYFDTFCRARAVECSPTPQHSHTQFHTSLSTDALLAGNSPPPNNVAWPNPENLQTRRLKVIQTSVT